VTTHSIIVSDADLDRLSRLVRAVKHSPFRDQKQLELLDQTPESAEVTVSERVPIDVIRMNSRIRVLDFDTQRKVNYTLVFPEDADISKGLISVLAPLGTALLGRRQGDLFETRVPGGIRRLRVERVRCTTRTRTAGTAGHRPSRSLIGPKRDQKTALAA